jgi:hypothetical protein
MIPFPTYTHGLASNRLSTSAASMTLLTTKHHLACLRISYVLGRREAGLPCISSFMTSFHWLDSALLGRHSSTCFRNLLVARLYIAWSSRCCLCVISLHVSGFNGMVCFARSRRGGTGTTWYTQGDAEKSTIWHDLAWDVLEYLGKYISILFVYCQKGSAMTGDA